MPDTEQRWLSERQAAVRLGASLCTVKRWREAGVGPPVVQLGARVFPVQQGASSTPGPGKRVVHAEPVE